ncbi:MAG: signal peptide peptidase SppA [Acidobacteria bacterium]|nr:signal peptide peptidase SppA [Acidobacteriota bacterium]
MRDFLKQVFASLTGLVLFSLLALVVVIFLIGSIISSSGGKPEPKVDDKAVLVFNLSTNISDAAPDADPIKAFQDAAFGSRTKSISLSTVLDTLDKASKDKRIVGLYLYGNLQAEGYGSGFAALKEVREALERFRAAGKTITFYDMGIGEQEYYLASVANTIALNPFGAVEMNGFASQPMFLADAFKKYGIGVQVTRVGKYKSAVEPYLLNKMSPENREQLENLLGDNWNEFLTAVGKSRNIPVADLQKIADEQALLIGEQAKQQKLVDKVVYFDEIVTDLKKLTNTPDKDTTFRQISLPAYSKVSRESLGIAKESKNLIAVVYAEGEIVDGTGTSDQIGGDRLAKQLRDLRQDPDVKAVVLRVNSPGGSASASEVIQREIILTKKAKPLIVSMGSYAASGGYWISTYADHIFAEPNTITGSIGVFGLLINVGQLANDHGVAWDTVKTGKYADLGTISRPKTDEELALIQKTVDQIYDQFLAKVSESRKLPREKVAEIAQGRVWSGIDGKELGLVDELGGLQDAIKFAAKKANLGDNWKTTEYPKPTSTEEKIRELLTSDDQPDRLAKTTAVVREFGRLQEELSVLNSMNDPVHVYARLPFSIRID